jgi:hypothetical protein
MVAIVTVYESGIIRMIQGEGRRWTRDQAFDVLTLAISTCPRGTGALAASHLVEQNRTHGRFSTGWSVSAGNGLHDGRALWMHEGTGIYGPRGVPIRPVNTAKKRFLHMPPGFQPAWYWTHLAKGDIDPFGHKEEVDGDPGRPWLRRAGERVAFRHGAI